MQTNNHATFPWSIQPHHFPEDYFKPFSPQTANTSVPSSLPAGDLASYFSDKINKTLILVEITQRNKEVVDTGCWVMIGAMEKNEAEKVSGHGVLAYSGHGRPY